VAQLIVVEGPNRGKTFEIGERAIVGTAPEAEVHLDDRRALPRQAELRASDTGRFEIVNLEPRKNLLVNGEVTKRAKLSHGDWITLGDSTLVFSEEAPREKRSIDMPALAPEDLSTSQVVGRRALFDSADSVLETLGGEKREPSAAAGPAAAAQARLAILYRVSTLISSQLHLPKLLDTILEILFEVFPADRGFILLLDEDDRKLKPTASKVRGGEAGGGAGGTPDVSKTVIREVFHRKEAILSTDAMADRRFDMNASIVGASMRSLMCAPFVRDDHVLGVIQLDTTSRSQAFRQEDLDLLGGIAMQCAIAIENARAYKKKQEYSRNLIYLGRATQRLSSFLDRDRIAKEAVKAACSLVGCTKGSLIVRKGEREGRPHLAYAIGMRKELVQRIGKDQVGSRFARLVFETGQPLLVAAMRDLPPDLRPGTEAEAQRYSSDSFLIVPVFSAREDVEERGRVIGCLCVTDKLSRGPFSGNDQEILQILASQTGIALANAELYEKATIDTLTKVFVRRHFMQRLDVMVKNAHHTGEPLSLVMIDLDHFKHVNDTYGHPAGDAVLKGLGKLLKKVVRADQICARYGGEEFAIILPGVDAATAARVAERVRMSIEAHDFKLPLDLKLPGGRSIRRTASLGIAALAPGETRERLIHRADQALYAAKEGGRNRVAAAAAPTEAPAPASERRTTTRRRVAEP
jgi:diguanylate cyclase (GGDEF)-like protein